MSNKQFEKMVTNLQGIMRCPHCSGQYQLSDIHYLGQMDSMTFLHMRCAGCSSPVFASVALTNEEGEIKPTDIATNQLNLGSTEETATETPELGFARKQLINEVESTDKQETPTASQANVEVPIEDISVSRILNAALTQVTYDDVLDVHQYLANFDGDFARIIG